jgi:hypothetical protein
MKIETAEDLRKVATILHDARFSADALVSIAETVPYYEISTVRFDVQGTIQLVTHYAVEISLALPNWREHSLKQDRNG